MIKREFTTLPQWTKQEVEKKEVKEGEPVWRDIAIGEIAAQGKEHVENKLGMQDSIQLIESFEGKDDSAWIGVYDGHYLPVKFFEDQTYPDKMVVAHLVEKFREAVKAGQDYKQAFEASFAAVDKMISDQGFGGSTASVLLIEGRDAWVANVGDSYVYIFSKDKDPELVSADHNINYNTQERTDAMKRGADYDDETGYIYSEDRHGMQLSRSLGDRNMGDIVISKPDVNKIKISDNDEWIVVASDGLWEELGAVGVMEILDSSQNAEEAQEKLIEKIKTIERKYYDEALGEDVTEIGNYDDAALVVVELKK